MSYQTPGINPLQPVPVGPAEVSYPWHRYGDRESLLVTQTYYVHRGAFRPGQLNAFIVPADLNLPDVWEPPSRFSQAILVEESDPEDVTNDLRAFQRVWVAAPRGEIKGDPSIQSVSYPGAGGSMIVNGNITEDPYMFRPPFGAAVTVRERLSYFTVGQGGQYSDVDAIPLPTPFQATADGTPVDYVAPWTSPTISAYGAKLNTYGNIATGFIAGVYLTRWRGSLYELKVQIAPYR